MSPSAKRVSIQMIYFTIYVLGSLIFIDFIDKTYQNDMNTAITIRYGFLLGIFFLHYFFYEKFISFVFNKLNLEENEKEDYKTITEISGSLLLIILSLISLIGSLTVFMLLKKYELILAGIAGIGSFFLIFKFIKYLILRSFEK